MNKPISVIEDLTPEPGPKQGSGRWRDAAFGLFVIALVVGFAGWQWWQTSYHESKYHAGQDALAANDWQAAIDYFQAASGYRDAQDLLSRANQEKKRSDEVYAQGMAYASNKNWIAAMQTLDEINGFPGYTYASATWVEAREQVFKESLQGTVVSRSRNGSSDLFVVPDGGKYRDFGGWYGLLNSDEQSSVQGTCTDGKVLYDVAGTYFPATRTPNPVLFTGRTLVLGKLQTYTDPDFLYLPIDPTTYDRIMCGRTGLWLYDYGKAGQPDHFPELKNTPVRNVEAGYWLTYVSFDMAVSRTFHFSDTTGTHEVPMAVDYNSDRMVIARWSGEDPETGLITGDTQVELYLVEMGGAEEPRKIFQTKWNGIVARAGGIQSVEISPGGRYVLINEFVPLSIVGKSYETEVLFIKDIEHIDSQKYTTLTVADLGQYRANWISSTFIRRGAYEGKIIQSAFNANSFEVKVLDPEEPAIPLISARIDAFTTGQGRVSPMYWIVAKEDFDGVTLVGREAIRNGATLVAWSLVVVTISADGEVKTSRTVTADGWLRTNPLIVADNRLIYTSDISTSKADWAVWSNPISEPVYNGADASRIYNLRYDMPTTLTYYDKVTFGPNLMAYIEDNTLHARSYDGKYDVTLGDGVLGLYGSWRYAWYVNELR